MNAIVCACGRRMEREFPPLSFADLKTPTHSPDECSRNVGFEDRLRGRREMMEATLLHLVDRKSLRPAELSEIRGVLTALLADPARLP